MSSHDSVREPEMLEDRMARMGSHDSVREPENRAKAAVCCYRAAEPANCTRTARAPTCVILPRTLS